MRRVLGDHHDHQISGACPRPVIGYAIICLLAAVFVIASALFNG